MSENLFVILGMIRAEMPEISDDAWERIKQGLCKHASGERVYVPTYKKREHLAKLDQLDADTSPKQAAKMLGIGVRRVQQLKRLRG
jgi:hypothetical protein